MRIILKSLVFPFAASFALIACEGERGTAGEDGNIGPQGPAGAQGPQGDRGAPGDTGQTGPQGPEGPTGADGLPGAAGPVQPVLPFTTILGENFYPESMALSERRLFVTSAATGEVVVIDTQSPGQVYTFIEAGTAGMVGAFGIEADPGRNRLWVCDSDIAGQRPSTVKAFDLQNGTFVASYPLDAGSTCNALERDGAGNIYMTDLGQGRVLWFNETSDAMETWSDDTDLAVPGVPFQMAGVAWDGVDIYAANAVSGGLFRIPIEDDGTAGDAQPIALTNAAGETVTVGDGLQGAGPDGLAAAGPGVLLATQNDVGVPGAFGQLLRITIDRTTNTGRLESLASRLKDPSMVQILTNPDTGARTALVIESQLGHAVGTESDAPTQPYVIRGVNLTPADETRVTLPGMFFPEGNDLVSGKWLYNSSFFTGEIVRADIDNPTVSQTIVAAGTLGMTAASGIIVDEARNILWVCDGSSPRLLSFHSTSGANIGAYDLAAGSLCGDVTLDGEGNVYVTDSTLSQLWRYTEATGLEVWATNFPAPVAFGALNGLTWDGADDIYTVHTDLGTILRVPINADGSAGSITTVSVTDEASEAYTFVGIDGIEVMAPGILVVSENSPFTNVGRLRRLTLDEENDTAVTTILYDNLDSPSTFSLGVHPIRGTPLVYVNEAQYRHLPLLGLEPLDAAALPFRVRVFLMPED